VNLNQTEKQSLLEAVRIMSEFFWGPKPGKCRDILQVNTWEPIEAILSRLNFPEVHPLDTIKSVLNLFPDAQMLCDALEEEYVRLFTRNRYGISAPLYASCYREVPPGETSLLMGEPAQEMQKRLESVGLSLADNIGEPPDHLAIELEYLYFLLSRGWGDPDPGFIEEAGSFVMTHMIPWISKLHRVLTDKSADKGRFYPLLISLLVPLLTSIRNLTSSD